MYNTKNVFLNRYANELRYALIHAVFVTPIQVKIFYMPHTLRKPRQIKLADGKGSFDVQLRQRLEKAANELTIRNRNSKKYRGKTTTKSLCNFLDTFDN